MIANDRWPKGDAFRHCSEQVRYLQNLNRVGEPAGMPPRFSHNQDPEET